MVTRLKANTPFELAEERAVPANSAILSDRTGYLPKRLAGSRRNPLPDLVREVQVRIETGKVLRLFTNDLNASAEEIADLYKREPSLDRRVIATRSGMPDTFRRSRSTKSLPGKAGPSIYGFRLYD